MSDSAEILKTNADKEGKGELISYGAKKNNGKNNDTQKLSVNKSQKLIILT